MSEYIKVVNLQNTDLQCNNNKLNAGQLFNWLNSCQVVLLLYQDITFLIRSQLPICICVQMVLHLWITTDWLKMWETAK